VVTCAAGQLFRVRQRVVYDGTISQLRTDTAIAGIEQCIQQCLQTGARKKSRFHVRLDLPKD
jgi:hypothetical protein